MRRKNSLIKLLHFTILFFPSVLFANDTLRYGDFVKLVLNNHPLAKIADIRSQEGQAMLAQARGAFEPTLSADYTRKFYEGKNYYSIFNAQAKIPVWIGEVAAGYDANYGTQINPENVLSNNGQPYVGLNIPLIKNLITDKKRTALRKANLMATSTDFEKIALLNDLLLEAISAYWKWSASYQIYKINEEAVRLSLERHNLIIEASKLGDRPFIDTVESLAQYQYRTIALQDATLDWLKATFEMSNYTWNSEENPVIVDTAVRPEFFDSRKMNNPIILDNIITNLTNVQPEIQMAQLKVRSLDLERKLKLEDLKPQLNSGYYLLGNGFNFSPNLTNTPFTERYKFGVQFQMPMLFAQARAEYKMAKLMVKESQLMLNTKSQFIFNKVKSAWAQYENTRQQLEQINQIVINNQKLLDAEQERFFFGESNVFLINSRENKYIESREKLMSLYFKVHYSEALLYQQAGTLLQKNNN